MFGTLWENGWAPGRTSVDQWRDTTNIDLTNKDYPSLRLLVCFNSRYDCPIGVAILFFDLDLVDPNDRVAFESYTDVMIPYIYAWQPEPDGRDNFDVAQVITYVKDYASRSRSE